MSLLDRRILHGFLVAPRASFRDLAAVIGTSDQTVARRYRAMQAEIGLRITGHLADDRMGSSSWLVRIHATPDAAVPLAETLAARHDTSWVRLASGGTEITCSIQTPGSADRTTLLLNRLTGSRRVVDISAHLMLHLFSPFAWSWLSIALTADETAALGPPGAEDPDESGPAQLQSTAEDERLVRLLQSDGRTSAAALAAATGWHESTVRRRIHHLTATGALQFELDLDEEAIGIQVAAQLWLVVDPGALDATGNEIARHPEAPFVAAYTGAANLFVAAACRDSAHLYWYITERLGQIPAVRSIESVPVIHTYKRTATVVPAAR